MQIRERRSLKSSLQLSKHTNKNEMRHEPSQDKTQAIIFHALILSLWISYCYFRATDETSSTYLHRILRHDTSIHTHRRLEKIDRKIIVFRVLFHCSAQAHRFFYLRSAFFLSRMEYTRPFPIIHKTANSMLSDAEWNAGRSEYVCLVVVAVVASCTIALIEHTNKMQFILLPIHYFVFLSVFESRRRRCGSLLLLFSSFFVSCALLSKSMTTILSHAAMCRVNTEKNHE